MMRLNYLVLAACCILVNACSKHDADAPLMQALNFDQWQQTVDDYRGKVLVVDAWATWCEPCLERFPHMVELNEKYADQNVQFVSLNLDDRNSPTDIAMAEDFLARMNAGFPHYFMDENMMTAFEKLDFVSIPVVLIYDSNGEKRFHLSGDNPNSQYRDTDVEKAIIAVLNEKSGLDTTAAREDKTQ